MCKILEVHLKGNYKVKLKDHCLVVSKQRAFVFCNTQMTMVQLSMMTKCDNNVVVEMSKILEVHLKGNYKVMDSVF